MKRFDFNTAEEYPAFPCTEKSLPDDLRLAAAMTAIEVNPANKPALEGLIQMGMVMTAEHLAVVTSKYFGSANGVDLTVAFMEATPADLAKKILDFANLWGAFANVRFRLTTMNNSPQIRLTREGDGYWSYLGTDILHIPSNQPTMCLQAFSMATRESEFLRVVPHEFGHSCGFAHEHMRADMVARLDVAKTISYFMQTQGWNATTTRQQVLNPIDPASLQGSPESDQLSIMCYSLPGSITKDGMPIVGGKEFSPTDKATAAKLYPLAVSPPSPPTPPTPPAPPPSGSYPITFSVDDVRKTVALRIPNSWTGTVQKYSDQGATPMSAKNQQLAQLASELEAVMPPNAQLQIAAAQGAGAIGIGSLGGVLSKVNELIAALKNNDYLATANLVYDLLGLLLGKSGATTGGGGGGVVSFAPAASAAGFDWMAFVLKLSEILGKVIPIILTQG